MQQRFPFVQLDEDRGFMFGCFELWFRLAMVRQKTLIVFVKRVHLATARRRRCVPFLFCGQQRTND